jgi:hypothetical protein
LGEEYWRWGLDSFHALIAGVFDEEAIEVRPNGGRHAVLAFMAGIAAEEVPAALLAEEDPEAPLLLTARAVTPGGGTKA